MPAGITSFFPGAASWAQQLMFRGLLVRAQVTQEKVCIEETEINWDFPIESSNWSIPYTKL